MGLISRFRAAQFNSGLVRSLLSHYYQDGQVYTVPLGPLRGVRIRYHPQINYHAMLGLWELDNFRLLHRVLVTGNFLAGNETTCDVGANIGLFSLWLSSYCVPRGTVHAFEAAPNTLETLRDTISLNARSNIDVAPYACSDRSGPVEFFVGYHHHVSSLDEDWAAGDAGGSATRITVDGITLDAFFYEAGRPAPAFIKIDIEGGGVYALKGCIRCAEKARPLFLVESHTPAEDRAISSLITGFDYQAFRFTDRRWVNAPGETYPHPEGVWGSLLLCPGEHHARVAALLPHRGAQQKA